jgi:hypothetical protein
LPRAPHNRGLSRLAGVSGARLRVARTPRAKPTRLAARPRPGCAGGPSANPVSAPGPRGHRTTMIGMIQHLLSPGL